MFESLNATSTPLTLGANLNHPKMVEKMFADTFLLNTLKKSVIQNLNFRSKNIS
jgi:hypothetical protein